MFKNEYAIENIRYFFVVSTSLTDLNISREAIFLANHLTL